MRKSLSLAAALLLALLLAACQSTDNGQALVAPDSPVAFRVGGTAITVADFQARLRRDIGPAIADLLAQGQTPEQIEQLAVDSNVRSTIFDRMVQDELLLLYARRNGIGINLAALDSAAAAQLPAFDPAQPFRDLTAERVALARNQLSFEVIARNTRADMFRARHILVADEATADQVLAELQAGGDFAALAGQYSQDPSSAANGGDLGWTARGDFVPEFEEVGFNAELNTLQKVQSQFGFHIIEVLERQAGDTPEQKRPFDNFEALQRSSNAQAFYEETFLPWYDQLLADAQASGDLQLTPGFSPDSVPLPFPDTP